MQLDAGGPEIPHRAECLALIRTVPIGRLAFTDRALPAIQPVNFALDGQDVIILIASDSKLAAATNDSVVALQVDDIDAATRTGWSVTIIGKAQAVRDPAETDRLSRLSLRTWSPEPREHFIRIRNYLIGGQRIVPGAAVRPATSPDHDTIGDGHCQCPHNACRGEGATCSRL